MMRDRRVFANPDQALAAMAEAITRLDAVLKYGSPAVDLSNYMLLTYPAAGGLRNTPAGNTTFDFVNGKVARADGGEVLSNALISHSPPLAACRSGFLYIDTQATVQTTFGNQSSGQFRVDGTNRLVLQSQLFDTLIINASLPYECYGIFSTLDIPPLVASALVGTQDRFNSSFATTNTFQNVPLGPQEGGAALGASYLATTVYTGAVGTKVFMVVNTGANSADVNLQLQEVVGGNFVDSSLTGASLTIGAGNSAIIEEGLYAQVVQMRARSTSAGQPTTLQVQYRGFSATR